MKQLQIFITLTLYLLSTATSLECIAGGKAIPQDTDTINVTGVVIDDTGDPLMGATVSVADRPATVTSTDLKGHFSLDNLRDGDRLHISYVGMHPADVTVTAGKTHYPVALCAMASELDEVVVGGYAS
ncbi:MAG: carboxypeptidase-like regulatory domain-containing protein, partial [Muribaculaceae bacterium]|nr:carboxypeptidase-like regulatory domain-containing protein [Muribaculaceae bacterium]